MNQGRIGGAPPVLPVFIEIKRKIKDYGTGEINETHEKNWRVKNSGWKTSSTDCLKNFVCFVFFFVS
jgi:hypothetical protein